MIVTALTLLVLVLVNGASVAHAAATMSPHDAMSLPWIRVAGRVESLEGQRVVVRSADGHAAVVDLGQFRLHVADVLRPGRDVVLYGPLRADGTVAARGLALDYDAYVQAAAR